MVKTLIFMIFVSTTTLSCSSQFDKYMIEDLYVQDFHSDDTNSCSPEDVNLSHAESMEFFNLAKLVDSKIIHDHYEYAPCYIEGTTRYNGEACDWEIRAGQTALIKCRGEEYFFVCDRCDYLFE